MSAIILESGLVHYEALGRGKPLLFLHGWLGSWRYWVPTMVELSSLYRAYALDFWGFGDSDKASDLYSIPAYVNQVGAFMDQMGITQAPIIGHGLGAIVAVFLALQQPDRVEQIMAVSLPLVPALIGHPLGGYSEGENPARAILGRKLKSYAEVDIEAGKTDGKAVTRSVQSAMRHDVLRALADLDVPVLMVNGREDPLTDLPDSDLLRQLSYNVFPFILEGVQHYPMLEETSKFSRLLLDYLLHRDNWGEIRLKSEWKRRMR